MVTLVLPGYSEKNRDWVIETANKLSLNHDARPVFWDHWISPKNKFIPEDKASYALDLVGDDSLNIVAKSIGTLVAAKIIKRSAHRVKKVILCGIPLNDLSPREKIEISDVIGSFPTEKILCFQNTGDPHGSYEEVKNFFAKTHSKINIIPKDGNDHEYSYSVEFDDFFKKYKN